MNGIFRCSIPFRIAIPYNLFQIDFCSGFCRQAPNINSRYNPFETTNLLFSSCKHFAISCCSRTAIFSCHFFHSPTASERDADASANLHIPTLYQRGIITFAHNWFSPKASTRIYRFEWEWVSVCVFANNWAHIRSTHIRITQTNRLCYMEMNGKHGEDFRNFQFVKVIFQFQQNGMAVQLHIWLYLTICSSHKCC